MTHTKGSGNGGKPPEPGPADPLDLDGLTPESKIACSDCGHAVFAIGATIPSDDFLDPRPLPAVLTTAYGKKDSPQEAALQNRCRRCTILQGLLSASRPLSDVLRKKLGRDEFPELAAMESASSSTTASASAPADPFAGVATQAPSRIDQFHRKYGQAASTRPTSRVVGKSKGDDRTTLAAAMKLDPKAFPAADDAELARRRAGAQAREAKKQRPKRMKAVLAITRERFDEAECADIIVDLFQDAGFDSPREEYADRVSELPDESSNFETLLHLIDQDHLLDEWDRSSGEEFIFQLKDPTPRYELAIEEELAPMAPTTETIVVGGMPVPLEQPPVRREDSEPAVFTPATPPEA